MLSTDVFEDKCFNSDILIEILPDNF